MYAFPQAFLSCSSMSVSCCLTMSCQSIKTLFNVVKVEHVTSQERLVLETNGFFLQLNPTLNIQWEVMNVSIVFVYVTLNVVSLDRCITEPFLYVLKELLVKASSKAHSCDSSYVWAVLVLGSKNHAST